LHCAVREDKIRHTELLIGYGHAHDALNQDNLTPIQLAQKLGRTRILGVLDNPASRQRLLMKPKQQFANRKVDPPQLDEPANQPLKKEGRPTEPIGPPQPAPPPVAPAEPASQPLKKEVRPTKPIGPPQPAPPPVAPTDPASQPLKKEFWPTEPIDQPRLPPTVPMFSQPPPDAAYASVYPTAAFPPGPAMFAAAPASPFAGSYYPFAPALGSGPVYVPIDEFTSLQHRLLLLEMTTAQITRVHGNLCSTCHGKLAAAQCPSCGLRFCTPHWGGARCRWLQIIFLIKSSLGSR
jgi:hypothetical protein